uniref:Uncharacterized protein n=1 Tax=Myoviridae sp. ct3Oc10 TaxID=2825025 RepID=A0A8S5U6Z0_9CAUD|nr:MAG TPA: hypothetical protein [Myoviridae sp. ct3Oc10]
MRKSSYICFTPFFHFGNFMVIIYLLFWKMSIDNFLF